MFRNHVLTLSVLSLLVMGQVVTARAAYSAAPSYPDWAAAVVPAYAHARPWSSPIAARVQWKMYGLATTDLMPTVVAWYKARVHGAWSESEGGNTWSVKSGGVRSRFQEISTMIRAMRSREHESLSRDITDGKRPAGNRVVVD